MAFVFDPLFGAWGYFERWVSAERDITARDRTIADLRDKVERLDGEREMALAAVYRQGNTAAMYVAQACDEELDRSGALLGRVRDLALSLLPEEDAG